MQRIEFIAPYISGKVLDIGHSVGTLHDSVSTKAQQTIGMDIAIRKAERNVMKGDAERMPVKTSSFDCIVAGELIEHLQKPPSFLEECKRVLKKDGTLIITTPNRDSLINRAFKSYHAPAHLSLFNRKELSGLLEDNGFKITGYTLFPYTEESSEGSKHRSLFFFRKAIHHFLPKRLQEEMVLITKRETHDISDSPGI